MASERMADQAEFLRIAADVIYECNVEPDEADEKAQEIFDQLKDNGVVVVSRERLRALWNKLFPESKHPSNAKRLISVEILEANLFGEEKVSE